MQETKTITTTKNDIDLEELNKLFLDSVLKKNIDDVKLCLENGADADTLDSNGREVIVHAIADEQRDIIEVLLNYDADANRAMQFASRSSNKEILELILKYVTDINFQDQDGKTALMQSVVRLSSTVIRDISTSNIQNIDSVAIEKFISKHNRPINQEMVKLLLQNGADVHQVNIIGQAALQVLLLNKIDIIDIPKDLDIKKQKEIIESSYLDEWKIDKDIAKLLIDKGADINLKMDNDYTVLMHAVIFNKLNIVQDLIELGTDINQKSVNGSTPLHMASAYGWKNIVELLLKYNADVNLRDKSGATALYSACLSGLSIKAMNKLKSTTVLKELMEYANSLDLDDWIMDKYIVKLLIDKSADINIAIDNGATILMLAVIYNKLDIVKDLIELGADVNLTMENNQTVLHAAVMYGHQEIVELLLHNNFDIKPYAKEIFSLVVQVGNRNILELLSSVIDIHSIDMDDVTLLMIACISGRENKVIASAIKGLDIFNQVQVQSTFGIDNYSVRNEEVVKFLIEAGVDINKINLAGETAYSYSRQTKFKEATILLNKAGASKVGNNRLEDSEEFQDVVEDETIYDSLSKALKTKNVEMLKIAIEENSDLSSLNLFSLVEENYPLEFIKMLVDMNTVNINSINVDGKTALMLASENGDKQLVELLISNNANINIIDNNGDEAFDHAENKGHYDITVMLFNAEEALKVMNKPQKLVKILTNFTVDKPMKFTTHNWDFGDLNKSIYTNFDGYMDAVKTQWNKIKDELEQLSPNLHKKVYNFLWETDSNVALGWSSMDGLKQWCDDGNNPFDRKDFRDIVSSFKKEIEIRKDDNMLKTIFIQKRKKLKKTFKEYQKEASVKLIKLEGQTFYTDTEKFTNAVKTIFLQMSEESKHKYSNITVEVLGDSTQEFIELKITQIDSVSQSSAKVMLEEVNNGDFASIKENLTNLCDWSIESSSEDSNYRVNYLKSNNVEDIEELEYKPLGFTHILRFYNK